MKITANIGGVLCLALLALPTHALTIKLGSIAPSGSPWDKSLRSLAAQWTQASGGSVVLKIYPGGIAGDEADMLRKIKIGQLDAAGLSGMGLNIIDNSILAIHLPLLIRTDDELDYILDKLKPELEKRLEEKGFKVIVWSKVGWAHFFSKRPIVVPDDLKKHKQFVYAGDADGIQAWKEGGFNPVPLSMTDLLPSLQSGMVEAYTATPLSAASYQWFALAPNMCGLKWAPLVGGIVVATRTWNKIPEALRPSLMEIAKSVGVSMQTEINAADADAVKVMQQHGLVVNAVSPEQVTLWKNAAEPGFADLAGKSFEKSIYETIVKLLAEYRTAHAQ